MKSQLSRVGAALGLATLMIGATAPAHATTLLNLIDPPIQSNTPYALTFTATAASTTLSIAGYQVPSAEESTDNGVFLGGAGPNLLGQTWNFTPAASGSLAFQFNDGSSVNGLEFAGVVQGDYDTFSQSFATVAGDSYTVDFMFTEDEIGPSGFLVTTSSGAVPEPATWAMMLLGFAGLGAAMRTRRKAVAITA